MKIKKELNISIFTDESEYSFSEKGKDNLNFLLLSSLVVVDSKMNKIIKECIGNKKLKELPEIHYKKLNKADYIKRDLAKKYLKKITSYNDDRSIFIVISTILKNDLIIMKGKERKKSIEAIFTRVAITRAINRYVRKYNLNVSHICIDKGSITENHFFAKNAIHQINSKSKAKLPNKIIYVDSDTRKEKKFKKGAFFIQWSDLILGLYKNWIEQNPSKKFKLELTESFAPYLKLMKKNKCKYGKIVFYPKEKEKIFEGRNLMGNKEIKIYGKYKDPKYCKKIKPNKTKEVLI